MGLLVAPVLLALQPSCGSASGKDNCRIVAEKLQQCGQDGTDWYRYDYCTSCMAECVSRLSCKDVNDGESVDGCLITSTNNCD